MGALGLFAYSRAGGVALPQQWILIALVGAAVLALGLTFALKR
ncbi:MAG: hypothetical protein ACE5GX_12300 [Thermoanaerobaculia bacterium]